MKSVDTTCCFLAVYVSARYYNKNQVPTSKFRLKYQSSQSSASLPLSSIMENIFSASLNHIVVVLDLIVQIL